MSEATSTPTIGIGRSGNVKRYTGPPPDQARTRAQVAEMTDDELAEMRAKAPDTPIALPAGHRACEHCGVDVGAGAEVTATVAGADYVTGGVYRGSQRFEFGRCADCDLLVKEATALLEAHPGLRARLADFALPRIVAMVCALRVLGKPVPETNVALAVTRLHLEGGKARWANPLTTQAGKCSPHPWAHVGVGQRAALRKAYAQVLRDRLALSEPPVALHPPGGTGGRGACLFCGVSSVEMAAIEVARRGGREQAQRATWSRVVTNRRALGGHGPERVEGHLCPPCAEAMENEGAVGPSAIGRALIAHVLRAEGDEKADRLRNALREDFPPRLRGWAAFDGSANPTPWSHHQKLVDAL